MLAKLGAYPKPEEVMKDKPTEDPEDEEDPKEEAESGAKGQ